MIDYDPHRWRDFFSLRGHMFTAISTRAGWIFVWGVLVTAVHALWRPLQIPSDAHALIGPALSLLLVFRTNASYDRFWEGRKLWGTMVNTSRGLARGAAVHLAWDPALLRKMAELVSQFPFSTMHELRGTRPTSMPTALNVSLEMTRTLAAGKLSDQVFVQLDSMNQTLVDCLGACERIHKTPLPFAYVMHLRRAIMLFCVSLPFALIGHFGLSTAVVSFVVSFILLGIEEIGVEIEDPFGSDDNDLPLEDIANTIKRNVTELCG